MRELSSNIKEKAIYLRKKGKTYKEICEQINVPKSTLSNWLNKVNFSKSEELLIRKRSKERWQEQFREFALVKSEQYRQKRENIKRQAAKEINILTKEDIRLIGCALYCAEGTKSSKWFLRFANSDPGVIRLILRFLRESCGLKDKQIKARVHIYPGMNYFEILKFWSNITKIPKNNFYKPQIQISRVSQRKRNKNKLPYGTIHLIAGNTEITSKVNGWIQGIIGKT